MQVPKVSIVIPSFNHNAYVHQCIDSVLQQTYLDKEIVVVDDGSTDGSLEILRGYGKAIFLISQANRGTQAARNAAIAVSSGELIAILDSDDYWLPHKLAAQVALFEARPELGLVYSFADTVNPAGERTNIGWHLGVAVTHPAGALAQLLLGCHVPALTAVFRRTCIEDVGLFDESLLGSGDWDLWIRIAARYPIACVEQPLACYRIHPTNTTKLLFRTKSIRTEHAQVLSKAFQLSEVSALPQQIRDMALARVHLSGAEAEAMGGEAGKTGQELRSAIELDPTLLNEPAELEGKLILWSHLYAAASPQGNPYLRFADQVFAVLAPMLPTSPQLRRRVLAKSVMGTVFSAHAARDYVRVRQLLPTGLGADPKWLLNLGVWSIAADAYLGPRVTAGLHNAIRRSRALRM